jgi:hypothetical protein
MLSLLMPDVLAVSQVGLALISAGSAVAGSLIGGGITGYYTLRGEAKRQAFARSVERQKEKREDQATLAVARGAAREWARRLRENKTSIETAIKQDHWWPYTTDVEMFNVHDDRKLIAAVLSDEDFDVLVQAESSLYNAMKKRDIAYEEFVEGESLPSIGESAERLGATNARLESAERMLRDLGSSHHLQASIRDS